MRAKTPPETTGEVERLHPAIDRLIAVDAQVEVLATGFEWSEGPVWVADGGYLLFSDVPANSIYRWDESAGHRLWLCPSGYSGELPRGGEPGSNGLLLDSAGRLVLCQHGDRRMARLEAPLSSPEPRFSSLAETYGGKRFNSPNDAVFHTSGALYFTDPPYGLVGGAEDPSREIEHHGVYRVAVDGRVDLLTSAMTRPNGLAFSPDESLLYVANSDPERAVWMIFEVGADGGIDQGRVFVDVTDQVGLRPGLPDGMKVDAAGNLYATGPGGVLVFSPQGRHLGTIRVPQAIANCAFGNGGQFLYMTAHHQLLRVRLGDGE